MGIRKIAIITFIAAVLGLLMPIWNGVQTAMGVVAAHPLSKWWLFPAMAVVLIPLSAIMPAFYFALYRYEKPLEFHRRFRPLSLAAALITTILTVSDLLKQVGLVNEISNLAYTLLLFAFYQHSNLESVGPNVAACGSRLLTFTTRVAVMVWAVIVAIGHCRGSPIPDAVRILPEPGLHLAGWGNATGVGRLDGGSISFVDCSRMLVGSAVYCVPKYRHTPGRRGFARAG